MRIKLVTLKKSSPSLFFYQAWMLAETILSKTIFWSGATSLQVDPVLLVMWLRSNVEGGSPRPEYRLAENCFCQHPSLIKKE